MATKFVELPPRAESKLPKRNCMHQIFNPKKATKVNRLDRRRFAQNLHVDDATPTNISRPFTLKNTTLPLERLWDNLKETGRTTFSDAVLFLSSKRNKQKVMQVATNCDYNQVQVLEELFTKTQSTKQPCKREVNKCLSKNVRSRYKLLLFSFSNASLVMTATPRYWLEQRWRIPQWPKFRRPH